jgi:uncharacterized SAM-binding protein YcdF (DUF218 family)
MPRAGFQRTRRLIARLALVVLLLGAAALVGFLPFAGRYLVVQQPLERADAIVVLAGSRVERWLGAVDLYRAGWAPRIVLSRGRMESAERHLLQMGIHFPADADLASQAMVQMKVPAAAILMLQEDLDNTAQEAAATRRLATASAWTRIIVVTSKYHSRRTAYAFAREFRGTPIRVSVQPTAYDRSVPNRWWSTRGDFRYVTSEFQKLLAYQLGLRE